jgi:hypothetical protein
MLSYVQNINSRNAVFRYRQSIHRILLPSERPIFIKTSGKNLILTRWLVTFYSGFVNGRGSVWVDHTTRIWRIAKNKLHRCIEAQK